MKVGFNRRLAIAAVFAMSVFVGGAWICSEPGSARHENSNEMDTHWTCSMHPQIDSREPGACPICGMDLIPAHGVSGQQAHGGESNKVAALTAEGIHTSPVEIASQGEVTELLGSIDYNETALKTVTTWIGGRVDRLHVKTTGQMVRRGQTVATLYSPEVYNAHNDLLQIQRQGLKNTVAKAAWDAARDRLSLLGLSQSQIEKMAKAKHPWKQISIRSQFSGTVTKRFVTQGAYVQPGAGLFAVANLKTLWAQLEAYESDLSGIEVGQAVTFEVDAFPGNVFSGNVAFVDPFVDGKTRVARVRVEIDSGGGELRPGMRVRATLQETQGTDSRIRVPRSALLYTGKRSVVFVSRAGEFLPATVKVHSMTREQAYLENDGALKPGESVVTHGAFLLDSEAQLRDEASMLNPPQSKNSHEGNAP